MDNSKITYHNPVSGMTRGTIQGLIVCGILLVILIAFTGFSFVNSGSPIYKTLDLVFGLFFAVAVVWVVGGVFEIEGKVYDFVVKAGGGAAIMFVTLFWLKPYSSLGPVPKYPISFDFPAHETLSFIIDEVDNGRRNGNHNYIFNYNGNENEIRQLRPTALNLESTYNGKHWTEIFEKFDADAPCLDVVEEEGDVISLNLNIENTITREISIGDARKKTIHLCNR